MNDDPSKSWRCQTCGYVYDERKGDPDEGLAPGTRWADIPGDWICPVCGTAKSDFDMVELLGALGLMPNPRSRSKSPIKLA
jgi:rubredoxin